MRRTSGGCFEFNGVESKMLQQLTERGALSAENDAESDQSMDEFDDLMSASSSSSSSEDGLSMGKVLSQESAA